MNFESLNLSARSNYDDYIRTKYFSCLDGLRCISVLAVIWHHTGSHSEDIVLSSRGFLGVDLFFAISGFLITTLLLRERDKIGDISLRSFYTRRTLRIFPLYYAVISIYVVSVVLFLDAEDPARKEFFINLPSFLTYTSNWFVENDGRVIFYFAWTLATEEQFYLVWPMVEKFLKGWRAVWLIVAYLILYAVVDHAVFVGQLSENLWVTILLSVSPALFGGVILAHLLHDRRSYALLESILGAQWSAPVILLSLLFVIEFSRNTAVVWTLMVLLVGAVVVKEANGLQWILKWRPVAYIGTISYGMYLFHMLSYNALGKVLPVLGLDFSWIWFPATVALVTIVAGISFRYYESFFARIKSQYVRL